MEERIHSLLDFIDADVPVLIQFLVHEWDVQQIKQGIQGFLVLF